MNVSWVCYSNIKIRDTYIYKVVAKQRQSQVAKEIPIITKNFFELAKKQPNAKVYNLIMEINNNSAQMYYVYNICWIFNRKVSEKNNE